MLSLRIGAGKGRWRYLGGLRMDRGRGDLDGGDVDACWCWCWYHCCCSPLGPVVRISCDYCMVRLRIISGGRVRCCWQGSGDLNKAEK